MQTYPKLARPRRCRLMQSFFVAETIEIWSSLALE